MASPRAANTASTMRLLVSTFPPATAEGGSALTSEPAGATTSTGAKAPAEAGMSGSVTARTTK
jgi:hypothetical protein